MFEQITLAITQGLTEFLPISSSGHVSIAESLLGLEFDIFLLIWLHASSLVAVVMYYWKDIWSLILDFFNLVSKKPNKEGVLVFKLLVATVLTAAIGLSAAGFITENISMNLVGAMLLVTAVMIYIAEKLRGKVSEREFSFTQALGVGIAQGMAVIPGLSRSGTTIAYLVAAGIDRTEAVRISFLLSVPTILGSLVFGLSDINNVEKIFTLEYIVLFAVGFAASYLSIRLMNLWIHKYWLWFIPYCLAAGLLVILFL